MQQETAEVVSYKNKICASKYTHGRRKKIWNRLREQIYL